MWWRKGREKKKEKKEKTGDEQGKVHQMKRWGKLKEWCTECIFSLSLYEKELKENMYGKDTNGAKNGKAIQIKFLCDDFFFGIYLAAAALLSAPAIPLFAATATVSSAHASEL